MDKEIIKTQTKTKFKVENTQESQNSREKKKTRYKKLCFYIVGFLV